MHSFLLKKRAQTLLLFFSLSFFFLNHFRKSKQNKTSSADDAYWSRNTTTQKTAQNFSSAFCDQNFSSAFALKKHFRPFLSTSLIRVKENERNGQDYQKYALFVPFLRLFFSPSLSLFCSHAALSSRSYSFSLSFRAAFVRAFVCARLCVSSGLIFVSEFCFHLNHKFSSRALSYVLTLFPLFIISHHLFIQFAASAPATSVGRPWP